MSKSVDKIDFLTQLGIHLQSTHPEWEQCMRQAEYTNQWFTSQSITLAVENIVTAFLTQKKLTDWASQYIFNNTANPKTIGITLAGNIPMVGFHDFLCVYMSPHKAKIKCSSKDRVLIQYCYHFLAQLDPSLTERITFSDLLKDCDAYIATGSNNSARYFEQYFAKYPHIIRKNRTSVAILTGNESQSDLDLLAMDVFSFFGLGCRNVTQIYTPEQYDFSAFWQAVAPYKWLSDHHKYRNNFDYYLAIYLLNKVPYLSNDSLLLVENTSPFSAVSVIHYQHYQDIDVVRHQLKNNNDIQCIVSAEDTPFGTAQRPSLFDYADGVDTMQFLAQL